MIRHSLQFLIHAMRLIAIRIQPTPKLILISLMIFALSAACSQRNHIDHKYSDSFRAIFAVQGQAGSKNTSPLTADDAKKILDRRDDKGSRGKSKSRTKRKSSNSQDFSSILGLQ
jgi:hypothetical protein